MDAGDSMQGEGSQMTSTRHHEIGTPVVIGSVSDPVEGIIVGAWLIPHLKYEVAYWLQGKRVTDYILPDEVISVEENDLD